MAWCSVKAQGQLYLYLLCVLYSTVVIIVIVIIMITSSIAIIGGRMGCGPQMSFL
jgi:hypothetical protein